MAHVDKPSSSPTPSSGLTFSCHKILWDSYVWKSINQLSWKYKAGKGGDCQSSSAWHMDGLKMSRWLVQPDFRDYCSSWKGEGGADLIAHVDKTSSPSSAMSSPCHEFLPTL